MNTLILLLGGILIGLMISMNGLLAAYLNVFEISLVVHLSGMILLLMIIWLVQRKRIRLRGAPKYVYLVGVCGVTLVVTSSMATLAIGAATSMALSIASQMIISCVIDHFGWFHVPVNKFRLRRIPVFCVILAGLLLLIYS
ncbi:MAG TPA: hypothetical protein DEP42_06370 [Ruminococcaceae bacterium]|nr:hypothetical protein [Oscillospiraceae bacterium]